MQPTKPFVQKTVPARFSCGTGNSKDLLESEQKAKISAGQHVSTARGMGKREALGKTDISIYFRQKFSWQIIKRE